MALLDRFLGGGRERALADGIALFEEGRYAEAVASLRLVARRKSVPAGSLAAYHFRQALLAEGRRLLRLGDAGQAVPLFAEAAEIWDRYADLHFLLGSARGLDGAWDTALSRSRVALRLNPDYIEARLLEAASLQALERPREAAASLDALLESGRRIQHWVIERLAMPQGYAAENLPTNLKDLLVAASSGQSEKEEVAAAVALCRAGRWEDGLERFGDLVARQPRYPDYRTRHAAALFQLGRGGEALGEIDAALALNEDYRLASDLKALILADRGQVAEARRCLSEADDHQPDGGATAHSHEDLFGAYLRGVLALLTGHADEVPGRLAGWTDLVHGFGRAELLLAAAESLNMAPDACGERLAALAREWSGESVYRWLWACHLLETQRYHDLADALTRWPAPPDGGRDWRPLYLEGHLAVCQGRVPALPDRAPMAETGAIATPLSEGVAPGPQAWTFLVARMCFLQGEDEACWQHCRDLVDGGVITERLARLQLAAAVGVPGEEVDRWTEGVPWPDSCLPGLVCGDRRGGGDTTVAALEAQARLHPEDLRVNWLSPGFWLGPVRGWIA